MHKGKMGPLIEYRPRRFRLAKAAKFFKSLIATS